MSKNKTVSLRLFNSNKIPFKRIQNFRPCHKFKFWENNMEKNQFSEKYQNNKIIETKKFTIYK